MAPHFSNGLSNMALHVFHLLYRSIDRLLVSSEASLFHHVGRVFVGKVGKELK